MRRLIPVAGLLVAIWFAPEFAVYGQTGNLQSDPLQRPEPGAPFGSALAHELPCQLLPSNDSRCIRIGANRPGRKCEILDNGFSRCTEEMKYFPEWKYLQKNK